ncbi:MAG: methyl-accepting chemotaxis protein [Spirochaetales bacterium]|uniref:Methyl-accepting chemotaxis protein n=1 Tax=Candidatus Thalassospirochaeta sargassi TaxID=3119039 RepID=A0AAJ1IFU9_9SPIO|nr:methyl-accepting chemotaxis protein [Spirochaetales bacterium]
MNKNLSEFNVIDEKKDYINDFLISYLNSQVALNSMLTVDLETEEEAFWTAIAEMDSTSEHMSDLIKSSDSIIADYSETVESIMILKNKIADETDFAATMQLNSEYEILTLNLSLVNNRIFNAVEAAHSELSEEMTANTSEQNKMMNAMLITLVTAFLILIIVGVIIAVITTRAILRPIGTLIKNVSAIASGEGDLTKRIKLTSQNEIGQLGRNVNSFIGKIHDIVYRMKEVSSESRSIGEKLEGKSSDIGAVVAQMESAMENLKNNGLLLDEDVQSANDDVKEIQHLLANIVNRIEEQAAAVNESSAAVEEMIASVNNISGIAESKQGIIVQLEETARKSESDMQETLQVITGISSNADLISDLLQVINNVADQTNLLAMNAAIEAAHAGDAGKGFAVVADEIRKLAETTSLNAKDISNNLALIITNIKNSAELTEEMGKSINNMTDTIGDVSSSMNEMTGGLQELAAGTVEVTEALNTMVNITSDVRSSSVNIREKSSSIESAMTNLSSLSGRNSIALEETSAGIHEINTSVAAVSNLGNRNTEFLKIMDQEIELFKTIDMKSLKSEDGQPLILLEKNTKKIPPRPENPEQLPETDPLRWWDMEYGGWDTEKLKMPQSKADGAEGKRIVVLIPDSNKPYFKAYCRGMQKYADHFNLDVKILSADKNGELQNSQLSEILKEKPDMVVYVPIDVKGSTAWLKKLYDKNIPVIVSNRWPEREGYKYILSATGPDHWGQARLLARNFAHLMNNTGEYCLVSIAPGSAVFYARAYGVISELSRVAPKMNCLEIFDNGDNKEELRTCAREWAAKYGAKIKGVVLGNDLSYKIIIEEFNKQGYKPEIIVAFGNSGTGMKGIQSGELNIETMQSAESTGALPLVTAMSYFNGLKVEPIQYLPLRIISKKNVERYLPPQW